jgi:type II secretory pathway pseudopilin PulG
MYSGSLAESAAKRALPVSPLRRLVKEVPSERPPRDRGGVARLQRVAESRKTFSERARSDQGFGLIELLMAMVILNVGILAIVASFNAGIITLNRASRITTGAVLADQQMELYRAIKHESIRLASATIPATVPYTTDTAYSATQIVDPACAGPPYPNECNASREATGADGKPYRVDTYIVESTPTNGRPVKRVTIVVRDGANLSKTYVRQASSFDQSTG